MATALWVALPAAAQVSPEQCGPIQNAYGPYDYRVTRGEDLTRVEIPHFPPEVEALIRGKSGYLGGDIDYTLRAFPNHHRALFSIVRWGELTKSLQPNTLPRPIECYFDRALRFRQDDPIVRMIYATFLNHKNRGAEADQQLEAAAASADDNPFTHYNVGLIYFDMKNYPKALREAQIAYGMGFAQPGLRDKLARAGKWVEPPAAAASSAAAEAASGAISGVVSGSSSAPGTQ